MRAYLKKHISLWPFFAALILSLVWLLFVYEGPMNRLFMTADQAGYRYFEQKEYEKAAKTFEDQRFKGASYFKAGEFENAKAIYQNISTKEGKYNLGNAEVMLGKYDGAISAYEVALKIDPNFKEAKQNLVLAKARKILKEPENDGEQGVGELGADEIVFDNKKGKGVDDDSSSTEESASGNANWLDRLQTGPKDFLKNKFRYQVEMGSKPRGVKDEK